MPTNNFQSIQCLRGVAALLVVFHHLTNSSFIAGAAGVDVFFVISGFIMGTTGVKETPESFVFKRLKRIVPLYWLATLVLCAGGVIGLFRHFTFDATTLLKSLLFIPYVAPQSGHVWPLLVAGWTLNYEMLFYALFAVGLLLGRPVVVSILATTALAAIGFLVHPDAAPLQVWTSPLLLEFSAGLLLSQFLPRVPSWIGIVAIGLGVAILIVLQQVDVFDTFGRFVRWGPPALLIVSGALTIELAGRWPRALSGLARLGDVSYSLYLLHGIAIAIGHRLLGTNLLSSIAILGLSLGLAFVSFHYLERPIARFRLGLRALPAAAP